MCGVLVLFLWDDHIEENLQVLPRGGKCVDRTVGLIFSNLDSCQVIRDSNAGRDCCVVVLGKTRELLRKPGKHSGGLFATI